MAGPYYVDGAVGNDGNAGTSPGAGNAWATVQKAADTAVAGEKVWVKASASYAEQVDFDTNAGTSASPIVFEGYTTTTGDGGRATITGSNARASCLVFNGTADFVRFKNFVFTSPTTQCVLGTTANTDGPSFDNCQFLKGSGTPSRAFYAGGYQRLSGLKLFRCEISGGFSGDGISAAVATSLTIVGCKIIDCGGNGVTIPAYGPILVLLDSIIAGNTGDGVNAGGTVAGITVVGNTIEGNGGDGLDISGATDGAVTVRNNVFANHSGGGDVGLRVGAQSGNTGVSCDYNFYYNNTTNTSGNNTTGDHDVQLTADPFTASASDNWTLNTAVGGGAAVRAAAFPGAIDATNVGYRDGGALQHADPAGGGGNLFRITGAF